MGDDCGCDQRKELLNKLFPYAKSMNEEQRKIYEDEVKPAYDRNDIPLSVQRVANKLYEDVFGVRHGTTQCAWCLRERMDELAKVYKYSCE